MSLLIIAAATETDRVTAQAPLHRHLSGGQLESNSASRVPQTVVHSLPCLHPPYPGRYYPRNTSSTTYGQISTVGSSSRTLPSGSG